MVDVIEEKVRDWPAFRKRLQEYASLDLRRRRLLVFRGHASSAWPLRPTVDRNRDFDRDGDRDKYIKDLLDEFRREVIGLGAQSGAVTAGDAFELLARHHGLPSPLLDWTESPFIASFFAFQDADAFVAKSVAIWMLDCESMGAIDARIDLIRDLDAIRSNHRALRQRGVFLRVNTAMSTVESLLTEALTKFVLPATSRSIALAELDEMRLNAVDLFQDLDSAARTARYRVDSAS